METKKSALSKWGRANLRTMTDRGDYLFITKHFQILGTLSVSWCFENLALWQSSSHPMLCFLHPICLLRWLIKVTVDSYTNLSKHRSLKPHLTTPDTTSLFWNLKHQSATWIYQQRTVRVTKHAYTSVGNRLRGWKLYHVSPDMSSLISRS